MKLNTSEMPEREPVNTGDKLEEVMTELGIPRGIYNDSGIALLLETIATEESDPEARLIEILDILRAIPDKKDRMLKLIDFVYDCEIKKTQESESVEEIKDTMKDIQDSRILTEYLIKNGEDFDQSCSKLFAVSMYHLPEWYLVYHAIKKELSS